MSEAVGRRRPVLLGASDDRLLDADELLGDVFADEAGRSLLILGEPGSGKSVLLRRLARDLLDRTDAGDPVPVLLDLAGWSADGRPFIEWLASADGLRRSYRSIGHDQFRTWLREGRLTLLLDGLDEVQVEERAACVAAINAFVAGEGGGAPGGIVVCCRLDEYLEIARANGPLNLGAAIYLRPLSDEQVAAYFDTAGAAARSLRVAWEGDAGVRELARNPLMLSTMRLAFERAGPAPLSEARERLLDAYVDRVFERAEERVERRREDDAPNDVQVDRVFEGEEPAWASGDAQSLPYGRADVVRRLGWLAAQLRAHAKTSFYVEEVQPSWLEAGRQSRYLVLSRGAGGALLGVTAGGLLLLGLGVSGTLYGLGEAVATGGLILTLSLIGALAACVLDAGRVTRDRPTFSMSTVGAATLVLVMAAAGALLFSVWRLQPMYGLLFGVLWGGVVAVVFEPGAEWRAARHDIRLVEPLRWSRRKAGRSALRGLGVGVVAGGAIGGLVAWVGSGGASWAALVAVSSAGMAILAAVAGGVLGGLTHGSVRALPRHNLGLRLSIRNAAFAGGMTALAASLTFLPLVLTSGAFEFGMALRWSLGGGLFCGALVAFRHGGLNAVYHATLRVLLHRSGHVPLRAAGFFHFATDLSLIRSAGGSYAFAHRIFADYFAERRTESVPSADLTTN